MTSTDIAGSPGGGGWLREAVTRAEVDALAIGRGRHVILICRPLVARQVFRCRTLRGGTARRVGSRSYPFGRRSALAASAGTEQSEHRQGSY
jgi:hypothetical protein